MDSLNFNRCKLNSKPKLTNPLEDLFARLVAAKDLTPEKFGGKNNLTFRGLTGDGMAAEIHTGRPRLF